MVVQLVYVRTDEQLADIFTKGLAYPRFVRLVHRVRGHHDIYVISDCDAVAKLFDSLTVTVSTAKISMC